MTRPRRYVGLMSGTSADGIDAAIVEIEPASGSPVLVDAKAYPLSDEIKTRIEAFITGRDCTIDTSLALNNDLGHCFASAALSVLDGRDADAIGCHGQTVLHRPEKHYTLQLGSGAVIAEKTGITTVTDFRSRDMVLGGQGAPFAPAFHNAVFRDSKVHRLIVNIGGIANISSLPTDVNASVIGFDSGPGNTLLDSWCQTHTKNRYDANGAWADTGSIDDTLLEQLLNDSYLQLKPPKSTGREHYHLPWLNAAIDRCGVPTISPVDVQATLTEFTALTIVSAAKRFCPDGTAMYVCGGGAHNGYLLESIEHHFPGSVGTTKDLGIDPDWVEAIAFAWLAWRTLNGQSGNLPDVTGATRAAVMGCIWPGENT